MTLRGFPKIISIIRSERKFEILLKAHGPNLRSLLKQIPGEKFSMTSTLKIMIQLIQRLKILHKLGYVHNDIKPANTLVGFKDPGTIYLIDFGIAHKYLKADGSHIRSKFQSQFVGNFLYASFNSCTKKI